MASLSRSDRLDLLARVLRDRPGITASDLAAEMGVSVRSVFRDLDHLRERGYPIEADRGRGGGLRLPGNWGLGRVLLSREEALCALLALAVSERIGLPVFANELARARRKIADAFPDVERRRIAPLRERIFVGPPASRAVRESYRAPSGTTASLRRLQAAFVDECVVECEYVREDGERSRRALEPHALLINWPAWYLVAHDRLRGAARTFRLDRVVAVDIRTERFRPRPRDMVADLLTLPDLRLEQV